MASPSGQDNPPGGVAAAPFVKGESFTAPGTAAVFLVGQAFEPDALFAAVSGWKA